MKKMDDKAIVAALKFHLQACAGFTSDGLQKARTDALNYYLQRPRGDEVNGRSQSVAGDLSASVEANLAQMLDAYTTDNIAEFDPLDADDEDAAQLESDAVVYFVMKQQNGYIEVASATKSALLSRNGFGKVWAEDAQRTITKTFENVAPEVIEDVKAGFAKDAQEVSYENGTLVLRATVQEKRFRAEAVAPENFFHPADADTFNLQDVVAVFERHCDTRSHMIGTLHFDKKQVERLKAYAGSQASRPDAAARLPGSISTAPAQSTLDPSQEKCEWFEGYVLMDVDGDGISERRKFCFSYSDDELLANEPHALVPYCTGVTLMMPHSIMGISDYDKLRHVQDERTGLKRARYDNINTVTKNRLAYLDGAVNPDDVNDGRPNGAMRVKSDTVQDVRAAVMPFPVPDNTANILANDEALKRERSEMGGASLDLASGQMQIGGERMGSQGLDRAYSVMEQLAALKTRTFASTFLRNLFLLAHATLREYFTSPVPIKRNGKWYHPVPAHWPERKCVTVRVGMSPGERARRAQALRTTIDDLAKLTQLGMEGTLTEVTGFYKALMDWARVSDVPNPEQYWIDPESPRAQKAFKDKAQQQQAEQQKREALMTQAVQIEQIKTALDKYIADQKTQFDYWAETLRAEIEEAKIAGNAALELVKQKGEMKNGATNGKAAQPGTGAAAKRSPAADSR